VSRDVVVLIRDDLDQTPDALPVIFGWEAQWYEIDLGPENYARLAKAVAPFVAAARPAEPPTEEALLEYRAEMRARVQAWGEANGHPATRPARGGLYFPAALLRAFAQEHGLPLDMVQTACSAPSRTRKSPS
jgi:hypothetical protein